MEMEKVEIDFRTALLKDYDDCWNVIDQARQQMIESGRHQWTPDYPSRQNILDDINNGNAYVVTVDGKIAVYGAVILNGEPAYDYLDGKWITNGNYYVVHRFACLPQLQREGFAQIFLKKLSSTCQVEKVPSIKVDTNYDNFPMIHLLSIMGYCYCGIITYGTRGKRLAFERLTMRQDQIDQLEK